jgi:ergothioneine biosynthesis protein EgtB
MTRNRIALHERTAAARESAAEGGGSMGDSMDRQALLARYRDTRALSVDLCRPLKAEDFRIQSMPDVSPPWWNLGHTSWFFAKHILEPFGLYHAGDARLEYALNSYYESLGPRLARDHRGLVTRPTTEEVYSFRASVDERLETLIREVPEPDFPRLRFLTVTGIQHEQQHQELLVTEIKHILGANVPELREPYLAAGHETGAAASGPIPMRFVSFRGGLQRFGNLEGGWCWDNEMPVHAAYLEDFTLAARLVTNGEYLEFVEAGGYADPLLWLANGWAKVRDAGWTAPLYWELDGGNGSAGGDRRYAGEQSAREHDAPAGGAGEHGVREHGLREHGIGERAGGDGRKDRLRGGGRWRVWTLAGLRDLDPEEPVSHVSFYEADAFARWKAQAGGDWAGTRLPNEREWEHAARLSGFPGEPANFLDSRRLHPRAAANSHAGGVLAQMGGDLWEWTASHYEPYPGYQPFDGALKEYNGKFMDNQRVLRGGSCATPADHIRPSYRNFWPADTRFQFTGIRLARNLR